MQIQKVIAHPRAPRSFTRVISFTSGKGGVGKTHTLVNVAIQLARQGRNVLVLDADMSLANVDVLLGLRPRYTLEQLFDGSQKLEDIILDGPEGISIIPASSGVESLCNLDTEKRMLLMQAIEDLPERYEYLLIDTPAGIGADVLHFNSASAEIACVINNEPTSLTDAYALIKVLSKKYAEKNISVVANNVQSAAEGREAFSKLQRATDRYLQIDLNYLGHVLRDSLVHEAVKNQRAVSQLFPSSPASLNLAELTRNIDSKFVNKKVKGGLQFFFKQLLEAEVNGI